MIVFDIFLYYYNNLGLVAKTEHLKCVPYKYINIFFDQDSIHNQELIAEKNTVCSFIPDCNVLFANVYTFLKNEETHRLKLEIKIQELPFKKEIIIAIVDYYSQKKLFEKRVFNERLSKIMFSGDGNFIIFIEKNVVYIFDIFTNQLDKTIQISESEVVESVYVCTKTSRVLLASKSKFLESSGFPCGYLSVLNYNNLQVQSKKTYYMPVTGITSDLNNDYIASILWDGSIDILNSKQFDTICYFPGDGYSKQGINCYVDFFAQYIITLRNQKIQMWSTKSFKEIFNIKYSADIKFVFEDSKKNTVLLLGNNQT